MITRKALIFGDPCTPGTKDYLPGVIEDLKGYTDFLKSPYGGFWQPAEITTLNAPSPRSLHAALGQLESVDYSLVVFTGHGAFDTNHQDTVLYYQDDHIIRLNDLRIARQTQTIILDNCRQESTIDLMRPMFASIKAESLRAPNPELCRQAYDQQIANSSGDRLVLYSCEVGQSADDLPQGGAYSWHLLGEANRWAEGQHTSQRGSYVGLTALEAHERSKLRLSDEKRSQTPTQEKPRSGSTLPFAVFA